MCEAEQTLRLLRAGTGEELLRTAEEEFHRPAAELKQVDLGNGDETAALFCPAEDWVKYENMDAEFHLRFEESGVFLELLPSQGQGAGLEENALWEHLRRKNLTGLMAEPARKLTAIGWGREKIAPAQEEKLLDEEIRISVAADEMSADAVLLPPEKGGALLTMQKIGEALRAEKVTNGIDPEQLEALLRDRPYHEPVTVARGCSPQDGVDGALIFHFNRKHSGTPWEDKSTGKVDFKNLDWIEKVQEGDLLVTRTPAIAGIPGCTVSGKTVPPRSGKECRMVRGQKVHYNEEKTEMYAAVSGMVEYKNEIVQVSNVYDVPSDADMTVGNIDFDGSVVVHGNVISGMTIKATGDVTIYGGVQDATVEAGGDVTIMHGLQGQGVGTVSAEGTLTVKFIEQGRARARVAVRADEIVHSEVDSGGDVFVTGKHGSVVGGVIRACRLVAAQTVGTVNHSRTVIEVGVDPQVARRWKSLGPLLDEHRKKLEELEKVCSYLLSRAGDSEEINEKLRQVFATKMNCLQTVHNLEAEYAELQSKMEGADSGVVHILDTIFPGSTLLISNLNYNVTGSPIRKATFKISDNEVRFTSCDYVVRNR